MSPDGTWMLKRPYFVVRDNSKESTPRGHGMALICHLEGIAVSLSGCSL